jgi:alpha-amylase
VQITSVKPPVVLASTTAPVAAPRTLTASVPGETLTLGQVDASAGLMPKFFPSPVPSGVPNPTPPPFDPKVRQWKDDTIYFLLTDRFHDADPTNNEGVNKDDIHRWHGGDLQGVIDKLDYIRDTGSTAIWITPPMANQHSFVDSDGYHGYWPIDHYSTDKHVGTMEKFEEFVEKAHEKGLKVLLDIPLNHVAWEHPWRNDPAKHEWFHHNGDVVDWENQFQAENHSIFGLPDLAQENPVVEKALMDVGKFWAGKGVDGFRLDAVKNVPRSFWDKFNKEMHAVAGKDFYLVGEYYHGDSSKFAQFQNGDMDGLVDYPLYYAIDNAFAKGGSMRDLANQVAKCEKDYPNPEMMSVFLDNHDTKRFMTKAGGDRDKLKMALTFQMTINRIPSVYYGTEVAMESDATGWSETSRRDMEWDKDPDMHAYFQKLTAIRNDSIAMRDGQILEMWQDDQVFAYSRLHEKEEAIVVLNNNSEMQTRNIPIRAESKIKDGTVLKELLTGQKVTVKDGKIESRLGGRSAGIYMPVA